jgi:hypothetical protein
MKHRVLVPVLLAIASLLVLAPVVHAGASVSASASVKVNFTVAPGGMYLVGKPPVPIASPHRITFGLWRGGAVRTRVFGLGTGRVVFLGARARPFVLVGAPVAVVAPGAVVAAPGVVVGAPGVVVGAPAVVVQPPSVVVGVPGVVVVDDHHHHPGKHKGHHKGKGKWK